MVVVVVVVVGVVVVVLVVVVVDVVVVVEVVLVDVVVAGLHVSKAADKAAPDEDNQRENCCNSIICEEKEISDMLHLQAT